MDKREVPITAIVFLLLLVSSFSGVDGVLPEKGTSTSQPCIQKQTSAKEVEVTVGNKEEYPLGMEMVKHTGSDNSELLVSSSHEDISKEQKNDDKHLKQKPDLTSNLSSQKDELHIPKQRSINSVEQGRKCQPENQKLLPVQSITTDSVNHNKQALSIAGLLQQKAVSQEHHIVDVPPSSASEVLDWGSTHQDLPGTSAPSDATPAGWWPTHESFAAFNMVLHILAIINEMVMMTPYLHNHPIIAYLQYFAFFVALLAALVTYISDSGNPSSSRQIDNFLAISSITHCSVVVFCSSLGIRLYNWFERIGRNLSLLSFWFHAIFHWLLAPTSENDRHSLETFLNMLRGGNQLREDDQPRDDDQQRDDKNQHSHID